MPAPVMQSGWIDLEAFRQQCERVDVAPPPSLVRGFELIAAAEAHARDRAVDVLSMTDEQVQAHVDHLTLRHNGEGIRVGVDRFRERVLDEIHVAILPELDDLVDSLRDRFDELSAPIVKASQDFGITKSTSSDEIVLREDGEASSAYVAAARAFDAISPIVNLRTYMSTMLYASPTLLEQDRSAVSSRPIDMSAAFAAGDNWSSDGRAYVDGRLGGVLDWYALAIGGLRLNTPTEVQAKQHSRPLMEITPIATQPLHPPGADLASAV